MQRIQLVAFLIGFIVCDSFWSNEIDFCCSIMWFNFGDEPLSRPENWIEKMYWKIDCISLRNWLWVSKILPENKIHIFGIEKNRSETNERKSRKCLSSSSFVSRRFFISRWAYALLKTSFFVIKYVFHLSSSIIQSTLKRYDAHLWFIPAVQSYFSFFNCMQWTNCIHKLELFWIFVFI